MEGQDDSGSRNKPGLLKASQVKRSRPLVSIAPGTLLSSSELERLRQLSALNLQAQQQLAEAREEGIAEGIRALSVRSVELFAEIETRASLEIERRSGETLALALAIAEKIIRVSLDRDPEIWRSLIEETLRSLPVAGKIRIFAGVHAYECLVPAKERLSRAAGGLQVELLQEEGVELWSLRMETPSGSLDMGVEQQLQVIREVWGCD